MMNVSLHKLFATPVMLIDDGYTISDSEMDFILSSEYTQNHGGNWTSKSRSVLDNPALSRMKSFIDKAIDLYAKELLMWFEGNGLYVTQSWINRNITHTQHSHHIHPNSFVSGVFYLTDDPEPTVFSQSVNNMFPLDMPTVEANAYNQKFRTHEIRPERKGQMILFPSTTEHFVPPNTSANERMTLSFNTWASGTAGSIENLTHLELGSKP